MAEIERADDPGLERLPEGDEEAHWAHMSEGELRHSNPVVGAATQPTDKDLLWLPCMTMQDLHSLMQVHVVEGSKVPSFSTMCRVYYAQ